MEKFIEQFYFGNIDPQARSTMCNEMVTKEISVIAAAEEYLIAKLQGEEKSKFLDHINAWSIVNGESNLDSFIMGFRLGAGFTFVSTDSPFTDLLK